jgi:predicted AlkP superfamily pyrophosphatase or phosphodiesterase
MQAVRFLFGLLIASSAFAADTPRLVVVLAVDQMRGDYLARFGPYFGDGGFKLLTARGANFTECYFQHAMTVTGPGHATILSGVNPDVHGVISNEWVDRTTLLKGNCVEDRTVSLVGLAPRVGRYRNPTEAAKAGRSPRNFLGTTIGDALKARYGAAARVYGVSDKDRASILLAGPKADCAYWTEEGAFITSTYYRTALPAWVTEFNTAHNATQSFGRVWDRLLPAEVYDRVQGPDDAPGEDTPAGLPRTFPKRITGSGNQPSGDFFSAYDRSPFSNEQVTAFAQRLLLEEKLGQDDVPDLLAIGFSQTDAIGHTAGPDSHEVMDSYLQLDRTLAAFLQFLDQHVGLDRCFIVLTADHAVSPLPERVLAEHGAGSAARVTLDGLNRVVTRALDAAFGPLPDNGVWFLRDSGFLVNEAALRAKGLTSAPVQTEIKRCLEQRSEIGPVYTREELLGPQPLDAVGEMIRRSYHAERSADVVFFLKPYHTTNKVGISHGSPYDYDTHVALVLCGPGVRPGEHTERVHVEDIAPTLASLLGLHLPPEAKGRKLF